MHDARQRVKIMGAVFVALFAMLVMFAAAQRVLATDPGDQYEEPTVTDPCDDGIRTQGCGEETIDPPECPATGECTPPSGTTMMETTDYTPPPEEESPPPELPNPPSNPNPPDNPPDTDGPDKPDNPVDKPDRPDKPVDTPEDTPGDDVVVIGTPEGPTSITVTVTDTTLVCETPERIFEVQRTDLDGDGAITNVEDRAVVVAGETGSVDAVLQNTAATAGQAEAAVEHASRRVAVSLPETGGARLIPLGAGALLIGCSLIAFRLTTALRRRS